ncbi:MAG: hypothetical protein AB7U73_05720 [Pirellulales bacterium]
MASLNGLLDVLWIVVKAVDNDQILDSPAYEQLPVKQVAQVTGAQERAVATVG